VPPREPRHIKYRAELSSCRSQVKVTVLEQTHRGRDFALPEDGNPSHTAGQTFIHNRTLLGSWGYPERITDSWSGYESIALRGDFIASDPGPITFPTLQSYNDFKAAVLAYNDRYK